MWLERQSLPVRFLFALLIIGPIVWAVLAYQDAEKAGDFTGAYVACQRFVERQLLSPASARYPWDADRYTEELGSGRFRVSAYVDSQNVFGAEVRQPFICEVAFMASDGTWRLIRLNL